MRALQVWSVTAHLLENKLRIVEALPLTPIEPPPQNQSVDSASRATRVLANPSAPSQKAIDALVLQTGIADWELEPPIFRAKVWEWSAISPRTGSKARVAIRGDRTVVHQFSTNVTPVNKPADDVRLVVTPLGAARSIGASCFQVEIGPYEVVLDCGTRPKGSKPIPALLLSKKSELVDRLSRSPRSYWSSANISLSISSRTNDLYSRDAGNCTHNAHRLLKSSASKRRFGTII